MKKSVGILLLLAFLPCISHAGSRFTFVWRRQPACAFNPYEAGTIAVVAGDKTKDVGTLVSSVSARISEDGFFKTVAREKIETVLKEQALGLSGHIDPKTAANTGNLLGAQTLFIVQLHDISQNKQSGDETAKGVLWLSKDYVSMYEGEAGKKPKNGVSLDGEIPYKFFSILTSASGSSALVKVGDGKELCSEQNDAKKVVMGVVRTGEGQITLPKGVELSEDGWKEVRAQLKKTDIKTWLKKEGGVEIVDLGQMPDSDQLKSEALSSLSFFLATPVLPLAVKVQREVGDGKTQTSKQAVLKAKAEDWEEAGKLWKLAVQTEPRDHDAWGGLGIYYEKKEMKKKAMECYSKAREIAPGNKGFPNWLNEIQSMLNDYSDKENNAVSSSDPLSKYADFPYVVAFDKKTKEIKINAKGRQANTGDMLKIFTIKPLVDPVTAEVLEVTEQIKAKAQITAVTEKLWTAQLLEGKDIKVEDKVDVIK